MAKAVAKDGKVSLILPDGMARSLGIESGGDVSIYELRPGVYALAKKGEEIAREVGDDAAAPSGAKLNEREIAVVRALEAIRFDQRTPKKVAEVLGDAEMRVLRALVDDGAVRFFKSEKYKDGIYSIPNEIYAIARGGSAAAASASVPAANTATAGAPAKGYADPEEALEKMGYVVVEREGDAKTLSERLAPQIKKGEVMGVRGFDKRFYLARKGFYIATSERLLKAMKGGKDRNPEELAREAKLKKDECEAVLNIMREEGEVVEKKRGTYALA